jgi:hypothetical protein
MDDNEHNSAVHKEMRRKFDEAIYQKLGPAAKTTDFPEEDQTPENTRYGDTDPIDPDHGDLKVTPEIGDNYLGAEIMLPRGGVMAKGRVTKRKRDRDGNPVGRAHTNPILDSWENIVEFDNKDQTELTANLIAESMYAQCDPDRNQYVLLANILTTGPMTLL